jgi:hypothetical protein
MCPSPDKPFSTSSRRGNRSVSAPADVLPGKARAEFVMSREEAATELDLSLNGLGLAMQRGECAGLFDRYGRSVRFYRPALQLRALGLRTPNEVGEFCRALGIRDLPGLLRWLGSDDESETP